MEHNLAVKRSSGDQQSCESFSKASLPQLSQTTKLQGKSKKEKNIEEEEIIKYMSNLPTYLERRSNLQEKGLNVGVLDWERLERWHSGQKQIVCTTCVSSSSGSNRASAFSTIESSLYSRKGHTSPGRLRVHCPSRQSPVIISPGEVGVQNQDHKPLPSNILNGKQKVIGGDQGSSKYSRNVESELLKRNCLVQKVELEKRKQIGELTKIEDKQQILDSGDFHKVKKSIGAPADSRENKLSGGIDLAENKLSVEKTRSFSPFSRMNIGLSRRGKGSSSIEDSDIPHQSSEKISVKPKSENFLASANLDASSNDKRKSSPLRRLLDPILGPANRHHPKSLERDSKEKNVKSSNLLSETSTVQSVKVKLDLSRCRKIDVNDTVLDKKHGPTSAQALLQASVKNGLPLLTFAIDNVSDVLAATMKLTSSGKENYRIYTLFKIREVNKKNGSWISQGGKAKGRDYISNVVAQMKVSELQFSNLTTQNEFYAREFVLFSVDRKHSDQQNSDFLPIDELAAIVVKIPFSITTKNRNLGSQPWLGNEASISTTVILPSGNHSLPSKGGPSSLIERWNTGGTCDCGGWDLGCKLRIFTSSNQVTKKTSSSENCSLIDQLLPFSQEGEVDNQPILSMTMLKDNIFSIEFGSFITHIQAFSICIALLDSRNLCDFSFEEKTLDESKAAQFGELTSSNQVGEVLALPNPPLSPYGRV